MIQNFPIGISFFEAKGSVYKDLFSLVKKITWDKTIKSRMTASYGLPYNYSNKEYPFLDFPEFINIIIQDLTPQLGYNPNNCLINFYDNSASAMGFHSDRTDVLQPSTGITILSLGNIRTMRFKHKLTGNMFDIIMQPNRFLHMTSYLQDEWLHAILPATSKAEYERISLTFRKLIL